MRARWIRLLCDMYHVDAAAQATGRVSLPDTALTRVLTIADHSKAQTVPGRGTERRALGPRYKFIARRKGSSGEGADEVKPDEPRDPGEPSTQADGDAAERPSSTSEPTGAAPSSSDSPPSPTPAIPTKEEDTSASERARGDDLH